MTTSDTCSHDTGMYLGVYRSAPSPKADITASKTEYC